MTETARPLTVEMVADRWGCSPAHVRAMIRRGELTAFRLGGKLLRVPLAAVEEVESCRAIGSDASAENSSSRGGKAGSAVDTALVRLIAAKPSARLTVDGTDVDTAMLATGLAIPYAPGRAAWATRCRHWCPSAPRCEE